MAAISLHDGERRFHLLATLASQAAPCPPCTGAAQVRQQSAPTARPDVRPCGQAHHPKLTAAPATLIGHPAHRLPTAIFPASSGHLQATSHAPGLCTFDVPSVSSPCAPAQKLPYCSASLRINRAATSAQFPALCLAAASASPCPKSSPFQAARHAHRAAYHYVYRTSSLQAGHHAWVAPARRACRSTTCRTRT